MRNVDERLFGLRPKPISIYHVAFLGYVLYDPKASSYLVWTFTNRRIDGIFLRDPKYAMTFPTRGLAKAVARCLKREVKVGYFVDLCESLAVVFKQEPSIW